MPVEKLCRVPHFARQRILSLFRRQNLNCVKIARKLFSEGFNISVRAVREFVKRYQKRRHIFDWQKSGRKRKYPPDIKRYIDTQLKLNNELTAPKLTGRIKYVFGITVPPVTVRRFRKELGWRHANVKYAQQVRDANKPKRVGFCRWLLKKKVDFRNPDWVFTDECTIQLEHYKKRCFAKKGDKLICIRSVPKHPVCKISLPFQMDSPKIPAQFIQ